MNEGGLRGRIIGASIVGAIVLGLLGWVFWRTLPPILPPAVRATSGAREFAGVPPLPSALRPPLATGVRVAFINEPENVRVTGPGEYEATLEYWRRLVLAMGASTVPPGEADVLVAPEARCLGPVHRRLVAEHLARGRGLVTTGAFGAHDGVCAPLRDTLIAGLLGLPAGSIRKAPRRINSAYYAVFLGETVLGAQMPPGARIEMSPGEEIVFRSTGRELFYCDYSRQPITAGADYFDAAAVRAAVGRGRVVAFGFSPADLVGDWSQSIGKLAIANALRWAAGHHSFDLAPWPVGKTAAAVLAHDVEADFHNARAALEALDEFDLPGTAFIVGSLAQADPVTTQALLREMEIGTHTQRHLPLDTLTPGAHATELAESKRVAEQLAARPVLGLRPPEERYTPATLQVWADLGGTYVFANNNLRSAGPEIIPLMPDSLVLLGRVSEDDFEILSRDSIRDRADMTRLLLTQVGESIAFRGLYMFSYHSHMFSQKELLPVLRALAASLKKSPQVWTTTAGEVATWWRLREGVDIQRAADGQTVAFVNRGRGTFTGGVALFEDIAGKRTSWPLPPIPPGGRVTVGIQGVQPVPPAARGAPSSDD